MKYESRKNEKEQYMVKKKPSLYQVPKQNYITISGEGDPNKPDFSRHVGALYPIAYPIKFNYKFSFKNDPEKEAPDGYDNFRVFPLEGVWTSYSKDPTKKDQFIYTIMIRQPYFVTEDMFEQAKDAAMEKEDNPLIDEVKFEAIEDGLCAHILHVGPFDDEPATFEKLDTFIGEQGLKRKDYYHREIYLSDFRKSKPENLKTILRVKVEK